MVTAMTEDEEEGEWSSNLGSSLTGYADSSDLHPEEDEQDDQQEGVWQCYSPRCWQQDEQSIPQDLEERQSPCSQRYFHDSHNWLHRERLEIAGIDPMWIQLLVCQGLDLNKMQVLCDTRGDSVLEGELKKVGIADKECKILIDKVRSSVREATPFLESSHESTPF